ncbi:MAG TPA: hypothetical protein VFX17_04330 [Patescibacteria group bacterium]|nr:hypothetical protein [Patescibacteria group bacterium]
MMKRVARSCFVVFLFLVMGACSDHHHSSPTSPDSTDAASETLNNVVIVAIQRFSEGNNVVLNLYGNIQLGLDQASDPYGANIRLRVYDGTKFKTYLTGYANSAPIKDVNDTIIRDVETPGTVDFQLIMEPYGCQTTGCWRMFTFPNTSVNVFKPEGDYHLEDRNGGKHIVGALPSVSQ